MSITTISTTQPDCRFYQLAPVESEREEIEKELASVSKKINTWTKIAFNQGIDISNETDHLNWLHHDLEAIEEEGSEELGKLRELKEKKLVACRIVHKITQNFRYDVEIETIEQLKLELGIFTMNVCVPWCKTAKVEGVDVSEEMNVISKGIINDIEIMSNGTNHHKEVVYRRHLYIRQIVTNQIVEKIYRHRIDLLADAFKDKDCFDDERQLIIEDIRLEAQQHLPTSLKSKTKIQECETIFQVYLDNLFLYEADSSHYHELADLEVLSRSIDQRARTLLEQLPQNSLFQEMVENIRVLAHQIIKEEVCSENLVERINSQFDFVENLYKASLTKPYIGHSLFNS